MEYTFTYHIVTGIYFSDREFEFLTKCIQEHKQTNYAVRQGQFWSDNMVRRAECIPGLRPKCAATATIKQLKKVLLMSLEPFILPKHKDQNERNFAMDLHRKLLKIAQDTFNTTNLLNDSGVIYSISES